jgi:LCP family protein required for cell wall assembly
LPSDDEPQSRADLQAKLRKESKKAKRQQHRWRRRIIYTLSAILALGVLAVGGGYLYVNYRYNQIKKIHAPHLVKAAPPGQPFNILLVGSDSRAFVGNNTTLGSQIGNNSDTGGQRSDVTMVARFVPATKSITIISIPRDLWVDIPGNVPNVSGMNRINAAYDSGPDLLVQTIEQVLNIPINFYMSVNFPGFTDMVAALGGVDMSFPTAVKDDYTGLDVTTLGCQSVPGITALQLVRSRHLFYMNAYGEWVSDGQSDFSRIQRQDAFFRAVLAKVNAQATNPFAINGFISAAVGNLTISDTLTKGDLFHMAEEFKGLPSSHLVTQTLPTTGFVTSGGADVLLAAQPYADQQIAAFNLVGLPKPSPSATTTTTAPPLANSAVSVDVLNASGGGQLASQTASGLEQDGFAVTGVNNAPSVIAGGDPSEIFYGPSGLPAAHTLADSLKGTVTYVGSPLLTGNNLMLWVANPGLTVDTTTTTTTTAPGSSTTPTAVPGNVVTNTQPEPWNPVPCTLGAPATTTTVVTAKGSATKSAARPAPKPAAKPAAQSG